MIGARQRRADNHPGAGVMVNSGTASTKNEPNNHPQWDFVSICGNGSPAQTSIFLVENTRQPRVAAIHGLDVRTRQRKALLVTHLLRN